MAPTVKTTGAVSTQPDNGHKLDIVTPVYRDIYRFVTNADVSADSKFAEETVGQFRVTVEWREFENSVTIEGEGRLVSCKESQLPRP